MSTTTKFLGLVVLLLIGVVAFLFFAGSPEPEPEVVETVESEVEVTPVSTSGVIGKSVEGRAIEVYTFGTGEKKLLFVGGVHGGYEWNSVELAYRFLDRFTADPSLIPDDLTVAIIPNLNPDALHKLMGVEGRPVLTAIPSDPTVLASARFNSNDVDLNRNFDCKWQPESTWRGQPVSAGTAAFSEPETAALRDYVTDFVPDAVIFWHSQANTVYASECEAGVLPETLALMNLYAEAADYNTQATFDAYPITGDAEGWLASIGIPAITVEMETRESVDWERNVAGVNALFDHYDGAMAR